MLICVNGKRIDVEGNIINKNKFDYPYNYSPITIWINRDIESNNTVYSDRLINWNYSKYIKCCKEIWNNKSQYFNNREPKRYRDF